MHIPRRHLNYANVVATLALVFAMSGGALAAKHYLINSTKQINPKVLNALKGKPGKTGATGATGVQGPSGVQGTPGQKGEKGERGLPGVPATALWARIVTFLGGEIYSHAGTASVSYAGSTGEYTAKFSQPVNECSTVVTVNRGINGGFGANAVIGSVSYGESNEEANITFSNPSGTLVTPLGFNLAVFC
jgi:hypothetical protein